MSDTISTYDPNGVASVSDESWADALESRFIPTKLGLIHVRIGGNPDGQAMACWPSLMMDGTMWRFQYEHYAPKYRVVLIDSPGHGKSDALRRIIDLKDSADVLVEILDALDIDRVILLGNSWGGMLAGVFPAYYPERAKAMIGMNATASLPTTFESVWATTVSTVLQLNSTMPGWAYKAALGAFAGPTARATRPEFLEFLHFPLRDDPKSVGWAIKSILIGRRDEHRLLSTITDVPVLIVAGEEDSQFPVHAVRRMADAIPGGRFECILHTGHLAARENPDGVNAVIDDFLESIGA